MPSLEVPARQRCRGARDRPAWIRAGEETLLYGDPLAPHSGVQDEHSSLDQMTGMPTASPMPSSQRAHILPSVSLRTPMHAKRLVDSDNAAICPLPRENRAGSIMHRFIAAIPVCRGRPRVRTLGESMGVGLGTLIVSLSVCINLWPRSTARLEPSRSSPAQCRVIRERTTMVRYLVTGASGFLGGHLINALLADSAEVTAVDRRNLDNSIVLEPMAIEKIDFIKADIHDADSTADIIGGTKPDVIYHLAGQPLAPKSNLDPLGTAQDNILATYTVLEGIRTRSPNTKLIFSSSACFYGVPAANPPLTEEDCPSVGDYIYTATKIAADFAVRQYRTVFNLRCIVARFVNIYGPGDMHSGRIVPRLMLGALNGLAPTLTQSDGSDILSFLYVEDAVSTLRVLAQHPSALDRPVWNVSGSNPISIGQLMRLVYGLAGQDRDCFTEVGPRRRPVRKYLDGSKLQHDLGIKPYVDLELGMNITLDWYREHLGLFPTLERQVTSAISQ